MKLRRPYVVLATVLCTWVTTGCGLVRNPDNAAQVNDEVLTVDQLDQMVLQANQNTDTSVDPELARQVLSIWIVDQAFAQLARDGGLTVGELADDASLEQRIERLQQSYEQIAAERASNQPSEDDLRVDYSRLVCVRPVFSTPAINRQIASDITDGTPFADATTEAVANGDASVDVLQCGAPNEIAAIVSGGAQLPEFAEIQGEIATTAPGTIVGPIEVEDSSLLWYRPTFEELAPAEYEQIAVQSLALVAFSESDIEVASAYGFFVGGAQDAQVVALG